MESAFHSWESACPCPVALVLFHGACEAPFLAKGLPVEDPDLQEVVFLASTPSSEPLPPPWVSHLCEPSPSSHTCCWAFSQGWDSDSQDTLMACCHPTPVLYTPLNQSSGLPQRDPARPPPAPSPPLSFLFRAQLFSPSLGTLPLEAPFCYY